ncbi:cytochrome c biogenesis protein CcdA, partial [Actinomadura adrarensis]
MGPDAVVSGSLLVAGPLAVLAGIVSFVSPCVLPLVPGYLSYVTGMTGADLAERKR